MHEGWHGPAFLAPKVALKWATHAGNTPTLAGLRTVGCINRSCRFDHVGADHNSPRLCTVVAAVQIEGVLEAFKSVCPTFTVIANPRCETNMELAGRLEGIDPFGDDVILDDGIMEGKVNSTAFSESLYCLKR